VDGLVQQLFSVLQPPLPFLYSSARGRSLLQGVWQTTLMLRSHPATLRITPSTGLLHKIRQACCTRTCAGTAAA
jgi:hypothetical protein